MLDRARTTWLLAAVPLAVYLALAIATVLVWDADQRHGVTGDEPHYLVVASAIGRDGTFENTAAYAREFRTREIYPAGLAAPDAVPTPRNTHAVAGPHGLYNVHNVGLPLLLAVPLAAGGVLAAKLAMVVLNASVVMACWSATGLFTERARVRAWATGTAGVAAPFVFAAGQIYPDVLAGAITLYALVRFAALERDPRPSRTVPAAVLLAVAPWLQIKFAAVAGLLAVALAVRGYRVARSAPAVAALAAPLAVSGTLLATYNWYAFGRLTGPYGDEALDVGSNGAMVLAGLHVDANQGWLWQAPVWLLGAAALGALLVRRQPVAALTLAAYVVLLAPNAFHPNWYGGSSFSGRFFWSAGAVLLLPTVAGLIALAQHRRRAVLAASATAIAGVALVGQLATAVVGDASLLQRGPDTVASFYPIWWGAGGDVLPMLYTVSWAWRQPVTWAGLLIVPAAVWLGASGALGQRRWAVRGGPLAATVVATVVLGWAVNPPDRAEFAVHRLQHQVGAQAGHGWRAEAGAPGYVAYGALTRLEPGTYTVRVQYRSTAGGITADAVAWPDGTVVALAAVPGSGGETTDHAFEFTATQAGRYEMRVHTSGQAAVELTGLTVSSTD